MLLPFVGFTAMLVSLCGARPSQSVLTFAAADDVEQIGLGGVRELDVETNPLPHSSLPFTRTPICRLFR